jgi:hypothetical protein
MPLAKSMPLIHEDEVDHKSTPKVPLPALHLPTKENTPAKVTLVEHLNNSSEFIPKEEENA